MRRKARKPDETWLDRWHPRRFLSYQQFKFIGEICILWSHIEGIVDEAMAWAAIDDPIRMALEVTSRINGFDGKIAIIKSAFSRSDLLTKAAKLAVADTLGMLEEHKRYRDGVVHARAPDPKTMIARTTRRRGLEDEVLLSEQALDTLVVRLSHFTVEAMTVLSIVSDLRMAVDNRTAGQKDEALENASSFRDGLALLRRYHRKRKALSPLPQFPEEPPVPPRSVALKLPLR